MSEFEGANELTTEYSYDGNDNLVRSVTTRGSVISREDMSYDDQNRIIKCVWGMYPSNSLEPASETVTEYNYDSAGKLLDTIEYEFDSPDNKKITSYSYDDEGHMIKEGSNDIYEYTYVDDPKETEGNINKFIALNDGLSELIESVSGAEVEPDDTLSEEEVPLDGLYGTYVDNGAGVTLVFSEGKIIRIQNGETYTDVVVDAHEDINEYGDASSLRIETYTEGSDEEMNYLYEDGHLYISSRDGSENDDFTYIAVDAERVEN